MPHHHRRWPLAVSLAAIAVLSPVATATAAEGVDVPIDELQVTTTELASGLQRPTAIAGLPDGRLLITEKPGTVRAYSADGGLSADPVLDLTGSVLADGNEQGLLGIVPAPEFASTGLVYVAYTGQPDGALTLARVPLGAADELEVLLTQPHPDFTNHNGGQLAFGPDGYLYWVLGDGGGAGDPANNAQSLDTLLGKIVRLDVSCADRPYCVPADNPFVGVSGAREEIWLYGLRNAWRFSFDSADGSLWIGDVGQGTREEVDHLAPGVGGANLGWSCMEGSTVFDETRCDEDAEYTAPVFEYPTSTGCAVIGGHVYRGARYADLAEGTYLATDYCSTTTWGIRANADGSYTSGTIGTLPPQVSSFGADVQGELYVVSDPSGQLYQVGFEQVTR